MEQWLIWTAVFIALYVIFSILQKVAIKKGKMKNPPKDFFEKKIESKLKGEDLNDSNSGTVESTDGNNDSK